MNTNLRTTAKNNNTGISILKAILFLTNLAAVTIYLSLRIIFTGFPISLMEDASNLLHTLITATLLGTGIYLLYAATIISTRLCQNKNTW